jgi:hypothetical protein
MIDERTSTQFAWHDTAAQLASAPLDAEVNLVRVDKNLRPLVPRMKRLVEGYADFLRWSLREHSIDVLCSTARDLRSLAELFGMGAMADLCARLEWAAQSEREDEASQCIDQLAGLVHNATFVYT